MLDGVRDLLAERWAEDAVLVGKLRAWLWEVGLFQSKLCEGKSPDTPDHAKFRDYFDYAELIRTAPPPRVGGVRGRGLEMLDASWCFDEDSVPGKPGGGIAQAYPSLG